MVYYPLPGHAVGQPTMERARPVRKLLTLIKTLGRMTCIVIADMTPVTSDNINAVLCIILIRWVRGFAN